MSDVDVFNLYNDYWDLFLNEDGSIYASVMFGFDYLDEFGVEKSEQYYEFGIDFQNGKPINQFWGLDTMWKENNKLKNKLLDYLKETESFTALMTALRHLPRFDSRDELIEGDRIVTTYNTNEFWLTIKGIPANFMMLYSHSGAVINNRMILNEYPNHHIILHVNDYFLAFFKEKSTKRLYFLFN